MVGETPGIARVKKARFRLTQRWLRRLQRWTSPYLPTNERAAKALSTKRCRVLRVRLRRGRTLTETVLLFVWPALALYNV